MKQSTLSFQEVKTDDGIEYVKVFWGLAHIGNIRQQPESIGGEWYYKAHGTGKGPFRGYPSLRDVKISLMG